MMTKSSFTSHTSNINGSDLHRNFDSLGSKQEFGVVRTTMCSSRTIGNGNVRL